MKQKFRIISQIGVLGILLMLAFSTGGCMCIGAEIVGAAVGKAIAEETVPITKTLYQTDLVTLTTIVDETTQATVNDSEMLLQFSKTKDQDSAKEWQVKTLKGSALKIQVNAEKPQQGLEATEFKTYISQAEDGVLLWKRGETHGPFYDIIANIQAKIREKGIKIISDSSSQPSSL